MEAPVLLSWLRSGIQSIVSMWALVGLLLARAAAAAASPTADHELAAYGQRFEVNVVKGSDLVEVVVVRLPATGRSWEFISSGRVVFSTAPRDYDGDGSEELLGVDGPGGSCCPNQDFILAIDPHRLEPRWVAFPESGFETQDLQVEWDAGRAHFVRKDEDGCWIFGWHAGAIGTLQHFPPLSSLAEITGRAERWYDGPPETRQLEFDLDRDGRPERIDCDINARSGHLQDCALPVPAASPSELVSECSRLGVLSSLSHGLHELVCGARETLSFDGQRWRAAAPSSPAPQSAWACP